MVTSSDIWCHQSPVLVFCQLMFWSSTNHLSQSYSEEGERLYTLESTFLGYLVNGLWWCGQKSWPGYNTQACPAWGMCEGHPVKRFFTEASIYVSFHSLSWAKDLWPCD